MLEREATRADLNTSNGFGACAVTLRTTSGHALTSSGQCVLQLRVPPIAGTARVKFEVVDVRYPIVSVAMLVKSGHKVVFSRAGSRVAHGQGSRHAVDAYSLSVVPAGMD